MSAHLNPSGPVSLDKNINLFYIVQIFNVEMFNLLNRESSHKGFVYLNIGRDGYFQLALADSKWEHYFLNTAALISQNGLWFKESGCA